MPPSSGRPRPDEGEFVIHVRSADRITAYHYRHHPFDVVGWDGYLWPFRFDIADFQPITGRVHQPPPVHQTFQARNFVVCSFVPRKFDYHPLAIPAPYNHSNINSDEVIYYVAGNFMSRRGVEIASFTVHPAGIPHGPHPGTAEASIGKERTEELAVMVDTFNPLAITRRAAELDDPAYPYSWLPPEDEGEEASELAERGPEAFPDRGRRADRPRDWHPEASGSQRTPTRLVPCSLCRRSAVSSPSCSRTWPARPRSAETLDPEDLRALMSRYFSIANEAVTAHGGTVEKFIGDAVMAVFGLPVAHGDDPARALLAALQLRDRVRDDPALGDALPIRLGINTGDVIASSDAGAGGDFLITGDAVNTAARLQQAGRAVGDPRRRTDDPSRRLRHSSSGHRSPPRPRARRCRSRPPSCVGRPRTGGHPRTRLVGRDDDLAQLELVARRAFRERRPYLVSVIAPPGVGKSRLLEEFLDRLPEP